jgi:hypothetical protein
MIKYCLVFFSCILIFTEIDAAGKKVHFPDDVVDNSSRPAMQRKTPSDLKLVMNGLEG